MYVRVGASELARFENHTARIMIVTLIYRNDYDILTRIIVLYTHESCRSSGTRHVAVVEKSQINHFTEIAFCKDCVLNMNV